jgi:uncharacterized membrane protein
MIKISKSIASQSSDACSASARRLYFSMFGIQTIGATIFFGKGIPLYRRAFVDPASHQAQLDTLIWSIVSIVLIQSGYWIAYRVRPSQPLFTHALLGHVILFLARLGFIVIAAIFGFVFLLQRPEFVIPSTRYVIAFISLFSVFCYVHEIERWGKVFLGE